MIRLQIVERDGAKLYSALIAAMRSGELRTFTVTKRGRRVTHVSEDYPGWMSWSFDHGTITCEIMSPRRPGEEWKFLSALVGRLAHKYPDRVHSISIGFPRATDNAPVRRRKRRSRR